MRGLVAVFTVAGLLLSASPAPAHAPTSASCDGQFFSSHAGHNTPHPQNVGESVSATAQELACEVGARISATRDLSWEDRGL
jgi:hypothetical protein